MKRISTDWMTCIQEMPKVELHLHLEGAFTFEALLQLIRTYEPSSSLHSIDDVRSRFDYNDFSGFIDTWNWKNTYFRSGKDFELCAYHTLESLNCQHVVYVEPFFSPWDFEGQGLSMEEITESMIAGCARARRDFGIAWNLIADINREHGPEKGMSRIGQILKYRGHGVIGVGLGGREKEFPAGQFEAVYAKADRAKLLLTAHAGEADGPASVWAVLERLHVDRIGHGIRACEDEMLMTRLADQKTPLEVCITSNVKTGVVPSLRQHPIRTLVDHGLCVTVNSDDPTMFDCTLTSEYILLLEQLEFTPSEIKALSLNSIVASALDVDAKTRLSAAVEQFWAQYL